MKPFGRSNGMRSFPSEERSKQSPEWNHYRIVCSNGVIRLSVNGREVSGGEDCNYRKGYLALESEDAPVEFRNLRLKQLPSSGATQEMTAPADLGWRTIFTGLDLRGWRTNAATAKRWEAAQGRLALEAGQASADGGLWTEPSFGDAEFVLDCRPSKPAEGKPSPKPMIELRGLGGKGLVVELESATPGDFQPYVITVKRREVTVRRNEKEIRRLTLPADTPDRGDFGLRDTGGAMEFMNLYARSL